MATVFTKIINREIPAYIVAEDENHIAFLDVNPVAKGHTLVVPKKETDLVFDLQTEEFKELFAFAQKVAKKLAVAVPCKRVGMAVIGLEVPHAHIHLVPMNSEKDMDFSRKIKLSQEKFLEIRKAISKEV